MVNAEQFREMMDDIIAGIPSEFLTELNGGILLLAEEKVHPRSVGSELKIMGEYVRSRAMGRLIYIYYGSFMAVYGHTSAAFLKSELRRTILHELTHHLESLAGYRDLEVEDEVSLHNYLQRKAED